MPERSSNLTSVTKPHVFLDVTVDNVPVGRMVIELRSDLAPRTCENFRALCTGEKGANDHGIPLCYKGSTFHQIVPDFMCLGGDIVSNNGSSGDSIYGGHFKDENFTLKHSTRGVVSMDNFGPNSHTNASQFFICSAAAPWLDGKHVAFGQVVEGLEVLGKIEAQGSATGVPRAEVKIGECGQLKLKL